MPRPECKQENALGRAISGVFVSRGHVLSCKQLGGSSLGTRATDVALVKETIMHILRRSRHLTLS